MNRSNVRNRREALQWSVGALTAAFAVGAEAAVAEDRCADPSARDAGPDRRPTSARPWLRRFFRTYALESGESRMEQLPIAPASAEAQQLLREPAARVTIGGMAANFRIDWHVANQPTLLVPIEGVLYVRTTDEREYELVPGDVLRAEDLTGRGHVSGAGAPGCFLIQVQLPTPPGGIPPQRA